MELYWAASAVAADTANPPADRAGTAEWLNVIGRRVAIVAMQYRSLCQWHGYPDGSVGEEELEDTYGI